jgi:hypothetical protein
LMDFLPWSNLKASSSFFDAVFNTCKIEACCSEEKSLSSAFPDSFAFSSPIATLVRIFSDAENFFPQQKLRKAWVRDDSSGTEKHLHHPRRKI